MASPVSSVRVFVLVVVVALLQESTLAQRGQVYSPDGPFNGVYYSHSRVAFTPRKNRTQLLPGDRRGYPSHVPTAATTRQTVVAAGYRPSSPPSYLESGQVAPSYPETHQVVPSYPEAHRVLQSSPPSYPETRRVVPSSPPKYPETVQVAPYSPSSYPEARQVDQSSVPSYPETRQVAPTPPPLRLESGKVTTEQVVYTPAHHLESSQVAKKRKSQNRYGSSGVRAQEVRARPRGFASTSEYRGIQEGSYYDRSNTTAPANAIGPVFDWGSTGRRHHRHRHHHETTTPVSPQRYAPERYAEFGSRMRTYSPPRHHPTVAPRRTQPSTTVPPYLSRAVTTTRRYRRRPATDGGAAYHRRQRKRPAATMRRTSESVSYVAGSYFPTSGGARKPSTGFAVQHRGAYDPDPVTPSPRPPVYTPGRRQPLRDVRNNVDYRHYNDVHDSQHPFASFAGK